MAFVFLDLFFFEREIKVAELLSLLLQEGV